jgi:uncharacterized protein YgiM (DUF1202 family)
VNKGKREQIKPFDGIMTPPVEETEENVQEEPKKVSGTVVNCNRLNIRTKPSINSEPVGNVTVDSEVIVNLNQSNNEWFKVITKDGVEGFCMKKYVKIEQ